LVGPAGAASPGLNPSVTSLPVSKDARYSTSSETSTEKLLVLKKSLEPDLSTVHLKEFIVGVPTKFATKVFAG